MKPDRPVDAVTRPAAGFKTAVFDPTPTVLGPTPGGGWINALLRLFQWKR
jgi:hypothetical protein